MKQNTSQQEVTVPGIDLSGFTESGSSALDSYLTQKQLPSESVRRELFQEISRRKTDAMLHKDYKTGDRLATAEIELREFYKSSRLTSFSVITHNSRNDSVELKKRLKVLNNRCDEKLEETKENINKQRQQIEERHQIQREEFSKHWKDPITLIEFRKPSSQLLQIRELERRKALLNDFAGAQEMMLRGNELEKKETAEAQARAVRAMEASGELLLRQQAKDIEALDELERKKVKEIESNREVTSQPLKSAIQRDEDLMKLPPKIRQSLTPAPSSCCTARYRSFIVTRADDREVPTPRTFRRQVEYRSGSLVKQLSVAELDPDNFFRRKDREKVRSMSSMTPRRPHNLSF